MSNRAGYIARQKRGNNSMILGLIIAIGLLAYLVYTLVYPEKF